MLIPWLVSLAAVAPAQERPWVEIASAPGWIAYVDSASITPVGDGLIQVWGKVQYDSARVASTGVYDRQLTSYRVNCATSRLMHLQSIQYKGQTLIRRSSGSSARRRWSVAGASSLLDATIRTACRLAGNPATP
jgi:hypothetical protein